MSVDNSFKYIFKLLQNKHAFIDDPKIAKYVLKELAKMSIGDIDKIKIMSINFNIKTKKYFKSRKYFNIYARLLDNTEKYITSANDLNFHKYLIINCRSVAHLQLMLSTPLFMKYINSSILFKLHYSRNFVYNEVKKYYIEKI